MNRLLEHVEQTVAHHGLLPAGATVVVAVSGGADSLSLLDILHALAPAHGWRLHVATFDHRWRPESAADTEAVAAFARRLGLPATTGAADAPDRTEAGAREQRRAFLLNVAETEGAVAIALGHTADDRAETLLLNLLRGAGTTGLGAMGPRSGRFVRPLIECSRERVRGWAAARALPVHEDPSNADLRYERNRLRHHLLPLVELVRPGAGASLARSVKLCGEERAALRRYAGLLLESRRVAPEPGSFLTGLGAAVLDVAGWGALPQPERWLMLRALLAEVRGDLVDVDMVRVEALDALAAGPPDAEPQRLRWPAGDWGTASRAGQRLVLLPPDAAPGPWGPVPLAVPGRTWVAEAGLTVVAGPEAANLPLHASLARGEGWHVRSRRPGDRLRPAGRGGSRSVSELLRELGVPRVVRDRVPLLADAQGVLWLPGCPPDERAVGDAVAVGVAEGGEAG